MSIARGWIAALALGLSALAGPAYAAPVTYYFTGGSALITIPGGTLAPVALALNGISATFDEVAPALTSFNFTTAPNQMINLITPIGGYDQITVNSATLTPGVGYAHLAATNNGGGNYSVTVAPVHTSGIYSASYSGGPIPPAVSNIPIGFDNTTPLVATIDVFNGTFELLGVTLASIQVGPLPTDIITMKADLTFRGMTQVPEPVTLALIGLGLASLAALRARRI